MNTKKTMVLVLGFVVLGSVSASVRGADDPAKSAWAAESVKIDGQITDWTDVPRSLEKSLGIEYAFRNNDQNLYALLVFKDPKSLSTINTTGITLYFSPEGKKNKDRGIKFVQRMVTADELIASLEKSGQTLTDERKQQLRAKNNYMLYDSSIVDSDDKVLGPAVGTGPSAPPVFRFARMGAEVVYEFRVPMFKDGDHPAGIGTSPGQTLKAGFSWGGMTKEMRDAQISRLSSQGSRASDSGGEIRATSADSEGLSYNQGSPSLESVLRGPKRHTFWADVVLAAPEVK